MVQIRELEFPQIRVKIKNQRQNSAEYGRIGLPLRIPHFLQMEMEKTCIIKPGSHGGKNGGVIPHDRAAPAKI